MRKLLLVSLLLIMRTVTADVTIHRYADITGLKALTSAFLSKPEYSEWLPTQSYRSAGLSSFISAGALKEIADVFYQQLQQDKIFNDPKKWRGSRVSLPDKPLPKGLRFDPSIYPYADGLTERYVQKLTLPTDSIICFMGDFHGSVHSLLRNLWRLVALGHLHEDLTIKTPNFYMVFLGDYVDRGRWGVEVVTTLMKLKIQNWSNVHMVAGNHETGLQALVDGFYEEILAKFDDGTAFHKVYRNFFMNLPVALFVQQDSSVVQCCHGGIHHKYAPLAFLQDASKMYENVGPENQCAGLFWSDFCANQQSFKSTRGVPNAITAGSNDTLHYLQGNKLNACVRAHQDTSFGLKLFLPSNEIDPDDRNYSCDQQYLYHWADERFGFSSNEFKLAALNRYPVFTFTSAAEGKMLPYDCFGLVKTARAWQDWLMNVYEAKLFEGRNRKFVTLSCDESGGQTALVLSGSKTQEDLIHVRWSNALDDKVLSVGMERILSKPFLGPAPVVSESESESSSNDSSDDSDGYVPRIDKWWQVARKKTAALAARTKRRVEREAAAKVSRWQQAMQTMKEAEQARTLEKRTSAERFQAAARQAMAEKKAAEKVMLWQQEIDALQAEEAEERAKLMRANDQLRLDMRVGADIEAEEAKRREEERLTEEAARVRKSRRRSMPIAVGVP